MDSDVIAELEVEQSSFGSA